MRDRAGSAAPAGAAAEPKQPHLWTILIPKWQSMLARGRQDRSTVRMIVLAVIGLAFWGAAFTLAYRVVRYFHSVPEIGNLLAGKILGLILLAFSGVLLLSNLITALSTFFLAKDLDMLVAAPVDWLRIYLAKLGETLVHSSWMVGLLILPIVTAYAVVYGGGWLFPFVAIAAILPYLLLPTVVGSAITLALVNVFPARRTRDLLSLIALGATAGAILLLRFLRPEQLARPEGFTNLVDYLVVIRGPANPFLPSEWTAQALMNWLLRVSDPLPLALLWSTAAAFVVAGAGLHRRLYAAGFSKAQEAAERFVRGWTMSRILGRALAWVPVTRRKFILKDLRLFFRDTTQWSQLILLAVLLVVYVFNIRALPLFTGERVPFALVTLVTFLNQGLAGFILAAIAARFVFPSVSLEGRQLWLLRSSPLDMRGMLWSKYWVGTLPLLVLAVAITTFTGLILRASPFLLGISLFTTVTYTIAVGALAIGLGVLYPQFETENAAQIPTSFGGLIFMMTAISLLALIIMIEAVPLTSYLQALQAGENPGFGSDLAMALGAVTLLTAAATAIPLMLGAQRLESLEV